MQTIVIFMKLWNINRYFLSYFNIIHIKSLAFFNRQIIWKTYRVTKTVILILVFFHRFWSGRWGFGCFCTNTLVFTVHFLYMETRACKAHVLQIVSIVMAFIPINWYFWWQFLMVLYNIYIYKWLKKFMKAMMDLFIIGAQ